MEMGIQNEKRKLVIPIHFLFSSFILLYWILKKWDILRLEVTSIIFFIFPYENNNDNNFIQLQLYIFHPSKEMFMKKKHFHFYSSCQ